MLDWDAVADALESAKAIAWDECHKIYILMDDQQVEETRNYPVLITKDEMTENVMLITVQEWYRTSCGLKFVQSVATLADKSGGDFDNLIPQGADDTEDEDA